MSELLNPIEWAADKTFDDDNEKVKQYGLYLKQSYLNDEGMSEDERNKNIIEVNDLVNYTLKNNGLSDEDINLTLESKPFSEEEKIRRFRNSGISLPTEDARKVYDYDAFLEVSKRPDTSRTYIEENEDRLRDAAIGTLDSYQQQISDSYVDKNVAPFARVMVEGEKGPEERLIGGKLADGLTASEAYNKSLRVGAIRPEDLDQVVNLMDKNEDGIPRYKIQNAQEAREALAYASEDPDEKLYNMHIESLFRDFSKEGSFDEGKLANTVTMLRRAYGDVFAGLPDEDIAASIKGHVGGSVMASGLIEFDEDTPANNIQKYGYGEIAFHPNLLDSDSLFEKAIEEKSDSEKEQLGAMREAMMAEYYDTMDDALGDTYLASSWENFKAQGISDGKEGIEILREYKESEDYSNFENITDEMAGSHAGSYKATYHAAGLIADDPDSIKAMVDHHKKATSRAKVARFFGEDFGVTTNILSIGSSLLADGEQILAATAATAVVGGVGGIPAFVGRVSLRGLVKTAVGSQVRKTLLKSAITRGATMKLTKPLAVQKTIGQVIKSTAANVGGSSAVRYPIMMVQSGTQSGVSTYSSIYTYLKQNKPEMSEEEIRTASLYGGLSAGVLTAGLVFSFGVGNMGGLESAILQKATGREVKKVLEKMGKVKLTDGAYKDALRSIIKDGHKKFYGGFFGGMSGTAKSSFDEALEEGLDSGINTMIEAVATNQDRSALDVLQTAGWGAVYGGIFGAAGPAARSIYSKTMDFVSAGPQTFRRELVERQVIEKVGKRAAKNLKDTKSPKASREFTKQYNEAVQAQQTQKLPQQQQQQQQPDEPSQIQPSSPPDSPKPIGVEEVGSKKTLYDPFGEEKEFTVTASKDENGKIKTAYLSEDGEKTVTVNGDDSVTGWTDEKQSDVTSERELFKSRGDALQGTKIKDLSDEQLETVIEDSEELMRESLKGRADAAATGAARDYQAARLERARRTGDPEKLQDKPINLENLTEEESIEAAKLAQEELRQESIEKAVEKDPEALERIKHYTDQGFSYAEAKDIVIQEISNLEDIELRIEETPFMKADLDQPDVESSLATKQEKIRSATEEIVLFGFPVKPKSGQYGLGSVSDAQIVRVKEEIKKKIAEKQKDPSSQSYVPTIDELVEWYSVSKLQVNEDTLASKEAGYLFNNDPLLIKKILDDGHIVKVPDSYGGPINTDVFVIIDGEVVDVLKPSQKDMTPVSALKDTSSSTRHDTKASENLNNLEAVMGAKSSPVKILFKQAGFYSLEAFNKVKTLIRKKGVGESEGEFKERSEKEELHVEALKENGSFGNLFVLDGTLTLPEAIKKLDDWYNDTHSSVIGALGTGNIAGVNGASGTVFRLAANLNRLGLSDNLDVEDLHAEAYIQIHRELRFGIKMEYLRNRLAELDADLDTAIEKFIKTDEFVEFFDMKSVDEYLNAPENENIYLGQSKSWQSNLNVYEGSPVQKIAAYLYSTTTGQGGLLNKKTFSDDFLNSIREKGNKKNWVLKDGWENLMAKQVVKGLVEHNNFKRPKRGAFPNFFTYSQRVGGRIRDKARSLRIRNNHRNELVSVVESIATPEVVAPTVSTAPESFTAFLSRIPKKFPSFIRQMTENMENKEVVRLASFRLFSNEVDYDGEFSVFQEDILPNGEFNNLTKPEQDFLILSGYVVPESVSKPKNFEDGRRVYRQLFIESRQNAPNLSSKEDADKNRVDNTDRMGELGLVDGNPDSVLKALEIIKESGVDESHQLIAELLLRDPDFVKRVDFKIIDDVNESAGFFTIDSEGNSTVTINLAATYGKGIDSVLLHEYLHSFTERLLSTDPTLLTPDQRRAKTKLENLRQLVAKEYAKKPKGVENSRERVAFEEGIQNLREFISSMFTSPSMQQEVRSLKNGLLRNIINGIKQLFGIKPKTKLDDAFNDLVDFLSMEKVPDLAGRDLVERRILQEIDIRNAEEATRKARQAADKKSRKRFEEKGYDSLEDLESGEDLTETQVSEINQLIRDVADHTIPASSASVIILDDADSEVEFKFIEGSLFKTVQVPDGMGGSTLVILVNGKNASDIVAQYASSAVSSTHLKMIVEAELNSIFVRAVQAVEISDKEINTVLSEISRGELKRFARRYIEDPTELQGVLQQLEGDEINVELGQRLVRDMFVDHYERATRGYTSYEDAAFYQTKPSTARVFMRSFAGAYKKLTLRSKIRKNNPKMARMISEISDEISYIKSGGRFNYSVKQFDPQVPDESLIEAATAINDSLEEITDETTYEEVVAKIPMFKAYKISLGAFSEGGYTSRKGISAMFNSNLDPRFLELKKQADAVQRAVDKTSESVTTEIMRYLEKRSVSDVLLGDYLGRPDDIEIDEPTESRILSNFEKKINQLKSEDILLTEELEAAVYKKEVSDKLSEERERLIGVARQKRDVAASNLEQNHPALYENLQKLRLILDGMSKLMKDEFDVDGELGATIDSRLGIYVTRTYRAFTDAAYMDTLRRVMKGDFSSADQLMVQNYENALQLFKEEYISQEIARIRADDDLYPIEDARQKAEDAYIHDPDVAASVRGAMRDYVEFLDAQANHRPTKKMDKSIAKSIIDNIKQRKKVPVVLRKLLGQHDDSQVVENVTRSIALINRALSRESFISNMITLGSQENNKFVFNTDDLNSMGPAAVEKLDLVNMRTGNSYQYGEQPTGLSEEDAEYNKGFHHYIDRKAHEDLQTFLNSRIKKDPSSDETIKNFMIGGIQLTQGLTLTAKTLFGFGFFERNVIGNLAFFGPMQGLNPLTLAKHIHEVTRVLNPTNSNQSLRSLDDYKSRLLSLNLLQGDITGGLLDELLNENTRLDDVKSKMYRAVEDIRGIQTAVDLTVAAKKKAIDPIVNRLMMLSQAIDDFYKIGYYEFELSVLKRARDSDKKRGEDTGYLYLKDDDLEVMAAKKVRDTSQSYVDAFESVKKFSSEYGFIAASFLRFKADVIRIAVQTPTLIRQEMKSKNPVIKLRGFRRASGYTAVIGGMGFLGAEILKYLFGVSDEEDELNRQGLPSYQKYSDIWYFEWFGEKVQWDMTFLNPMSPVTAPTSRFLSYLKRGEVLEGASQGLYMFASEFLDSPILGQAAREVLANEDTVTKDKIYNDYDSVVDRISKSSFYMFKNAFEPRIVTLGRRAVRTIKGDEPIMSKEERLKDLLLRELSPVKNINMDDNRNFYSAMLSTRDNLNETGRLLNRLNKGEPMSDPEMEELAEDYKEGLIQIAKQARKFKKASPLDESELKEITSTLNMAKYFQKAIFDGELALPKIKKNIVNKLKDDEKKARRLEIFTEAYEKGPERIILD